MTIMLKKIFLMTCLSIPFSVAFGDAYADKQEAKFLKKAPEDVRQAIKKSNDLNVYWWATLESNQARVASAELQSAAAPCSTSPTGGGCNRVRRAGQGAFDGFLLAPARRPPHCFGKDEDWP